MVLAAGFALLVRADAKGDRASLVGSEEELVPGVHPYPVDDRERANQRRD